MSEEEKCHYCGGKLQYAALPKTVSLKEKSCDYATIRVCKLCGRFHEKDLDKEQVPFLEELRKKQL